MTNEELQELRKFPVAFYQNGRKWIAQQVNKLIDKIERLQDKSEHYVKVMRQQDVEIERLQAELSAWKSSNQINFNRSERYRKALEEIANYYGFEGDIAYKDMKQIAQKALKGDTTDGSK